MASDHGARVPPPRFGAGGRGPGGGRSADAADADHGGGEGWAPPQPRHRVVLLRNLHPEATAEDLGSAFGSWLQPEKILILPSKGHAFVEMPSPEAAADAVALVARDKPAIRGRPVYAVISTRTSVRFRPGFGQPEGPGRGAAVAVVGGAGAGGGVGRGGLSTAAASSAGAEDNPPSRVVLLVVSDVRVAVTVPSVCGVITQAAAAPCPLRVIVFARHAAMHALVEMPDLPSASAVVRSLDGRQMHPGCNAVRAQFSRMGGISVRFNNLKSNDFTLPLPPGPGGEPLLFGGLPASLRHEAEAGRPGPRRRGDAARDAGGPGGRQGGDRLPAGSPVASLEAPREDPAAEWAREAFQHESGGRRAGGGTAGRAAGGAGGLDAASAPPAATARAVLEAAAADGAGAGAVLTVRGLPPATVTLRQVFTLCGVYGDVVRAARDPGVPGGFLVELASAAQAKLCASMLSGQPLLGSTLGIAASPLPRLSVPAGSHADSAADFSRDRAHRFRLHDRGQRFIAPPSDSLHLSNMPDGTTAASVAEALAPAAGPPTSLRFLDAAHHMCVVRLSGTDAALAAIVLLHNTSFLGRFLRVSFARQPTRVARAARDGAPPAGAPVIGWTAPVPPARQRRGKRGSRRDGSRSLLPSDQPPGLQQGAAPAGGWGADPRAALPDGAFIPAHDPTGRPWAPGEAQAAALAWQQQVQYWAAVHAAAARAQAAPHPRPGPHDPAAAPRHGGGGPAPADQAPATLAHGTEPAGSAIPQPPPSPLADPQPADAQAASLAASHLDALVADSGTPASRQL